MLKKMTTHSKSTTSESETVVPEFGKWMSKKYVWKDTTLEDEQDLNKAYQIINEKYVI